MNNQIRILCVDDERNVLRALERIFLDDDYDILTAASGEEGLELLDSDEVQVVISDFRMPGMNGVEFLREVCKTHPETIRIVLSGYADTAAVVAAINEGQIYKFIPKPWNDDELRMTVAKALESFAIQRKNEQLAEELQRKNRELSEMNAHLEKLAHSCCGTEPPRMLQAAKILEQLPVGVLSLDDQGVVQQINKAAAELLRVEQQQALGKPLQLVFPQALAALAQEKGDPGEGPLVVEADGIRLQAQASPWGEEGSAGVILTLSRG